MIKEYMPIIDFENRVSGDAARVRCKPTFTVIREIDDNIDLIDEAMLLIDVDETEFNINNIIGFLNKYYYAAYVPYEKSYTLSIDSDYSVNGIIIFSSSDGTGVSTPKKIIEDFLEYTHACYYIMLHNHPINSGYFEINSHIDDFENSIEDKLVAQETFSNLSDCRDLYHVSFSPYGYEDVITHSSQLFDDVLNEDEYDIMFNPAY